MEEIASDRGFQPDLDNSAMQKVIADIYQAAAGTKQWTEVLTAVTHSLGMKACQMIGIGMDSGAVLFSHASSDIAPETELEYVRSFHVVDPRIPLLMTNPSGQWLYDEDVFDEEIAESNACYRDLLIPYGFRYTADTKLLEQDGEVILIGFLSYLGLPGFTPLHRQFLANIVFHLQQAAFIYQKIRKLSTAAFAGTGLLDRMARPAILLGIDRSVTFMNDLARQYVSKAGDLILVASDRLRAFDSKTDEMLEGVFQGIGHDVLKAGVPERRVIQLGRQNSDARATASLTAFIPSASMFAFGSQAQVLLIIHDQALPALPDTLLWEAAFNLTPSQSRVAAEIYRGRSVKEAANLLKISRATVNTHLRDIFWKLGIRRQSQLVLVMANLQSV